MASGINHNFYIYKGVAYLLPFSRGCQLGGTYFDDVIILVFKRLIELPNCKSDEEFIAGIKSSTRLKFQFSSIFTVLSQHGYQL